MDILSVPPPLVRSLSKWGRGIAIFLALALVLQLVFGYSLNNDHYGDELRQFISLQPELVAGTGSIRSIRIVRRVVFYGSSDIEQYREYTCIVKGTLASARVVVRLEQLGEIRFEIQGAEILR